MSIRLFCAVDLGVDTRDRLAHALKRVRSQAPEAKWVAAESMHLTLSFLGWVDESRVGEIAAAMHRAALSTHAFELGVAGAGTFGSERRPRVLWVSITKQVAELTALQQSLAKELSAIGFEPEDRAFSPHVTLARAKERGGDASLAKCRDAIGAEDFGTFQVDEVVLYKSELERSGARYTPLETSKLA